MTVEACGPWALLCGETLQQPAAALLCRMHRTLNRTPCPAAVGKGLRGQRVTKMLGNAGL